MKILVVFANPRGTNALRLGEEDRTIQECIRRSKNRDRLTLTIRHAVTIDDVRRALLDDDYHVVHFSGHGTGTGLAFESSSGMLYVPPREALAGLLADFSPPIECLILNACYSMSQGQFTSLGVPYSVAMEGPISDDAAIIFAGGFYDSLGAGKDIEFSFRQGIAALRLAGHTDSTVPHLLKKNAITVLEPSAPIQNGQPGSLNRSIPSGHRTLVLGIGLDVSGSMEQKIATSLNRSETRLQGFASAFERSISRTRDFVQATPDDLKSSAFVFAYAFGMRSGSVCDLLSLVKAAEGIISEAEIEQLKDQYAREIKQRYSRDSGIGGLESLARSYGFGGFVDSVKQGIRTDAEAEVQNRIMAEVQRRLSDRLRAIGETTMTLNEVANIWKSDSASWNNAEVLVFGDTPMCAALKKAVERFKSEINRHISADPISVFLLVSDGEPTDGDPVPLARELRDLGVTIISCYITDHDLLAIRTLVNKPDPTWPRGAQVMFDLASEVLDDSFFAHSLLRSGWSISKQSKAFLQANHSAILEELVGMATSPVETGYQLLPKGR
ncbi:MAG: CHAT domain-containing protein [Acidobacteriia bacterium]|nr:CHAT domain-containing protein [Terriglobia bacterium]